MSSNNESLLNNESLSRATYFNAAQLQQQQYQYQLQQQQQLLNYQHNNYNQLNNIQHIQQQQHHSLHHQQQQQIYQHQPLTNVFPSIYSETTNYNLKNMSNNMTSSSGGSSTTSVPAAASASTGVTSTSHYSSVQRQIQQDWSNREYIEIIILNIKKLTDFLNSFELSCRSKMAMLDEKLTKIERQIDFVEAKVTKGETLN